jgi:hypothetical protein
VNTKVDSNGYLTLSVQLKMAAPLEKCTKEEQCSVIGFLSSDGIKPQEMHRRMKTQYRDACISLQQMYEWDRKFKNEMSSVADADRSGRPHQTAKHAEQLIRETHHVTNEVALELGISHGSAHHIMHDVLQYHKVRAQWVPRQLTAELKERHMDACKELLGHYQTERDAFLQCIVTEDDGWAHYFQS